MHQLDWKLCKEMKFFWCLLEKRNSPSLEGYSLEQQSLCMSEMHVRMFTKT